MTEFSNPYRPGEPVNDPAMLFGRQDAADWLDLQLAGGSRTLILAGSPLIGKTSFLRHVGTLQSRPTLNLLVSLADLPVIGLNQGQKPGESEQTLNTVLQAVIEQLVPQLALLKLRESQTAPRAAQSATALRELFAAVAPNVPSGQAILLFFDDVHKLVTTDLALIASFLTSLMPLLDECLALRLIFTVNQNSLKHVRHPLLDGAPVYTLGALPTDASINMVTEPVKGVLRFDYGVTRRITEICSHHPYYVSLYCHTLLDRQVHDGWVNQQDFDNTLAEILDSPIEAFTQIWEHSTWAERAVLVGMSAIQGAHGPITGQEIIRSMQRTNDAVEPEVVKHALNTLADRGVLTPMGAISFRFQVEMLRFWLREHTTPAEVMAQVNWSKAATDLRPKEKETWRAGQSAPRRKKSSTELVPAPRRRGSLLLPLLLGLLIVCGALAIGGILAARYFNLPLPFEAAPMAPIDSAPNSVALPGEGEATVTPTPEPTATASPPTPTPALVVSRSLPSITFMAREVDQNWRIYVMDADGSNELPLTPAGPDDDTSPVWSPEGRRIAFVSKRDGNRELYVMDVDGQNAVNVTRHPADDWTPAWSPDGSKIAFSSFRDGSWEIYLLDAACLSQPNTCPEALTQVTGDGNGNLSPVWSPDGTRLAYNSKANGNWDIYTMNLGGTDIRQVTVSPANDLAPIWSPDGSQIAYESNADGDVEIYVIGAVGGMPRNITNQPQANDHGPTWSPDGQQLIFYSNREGNWDIFTTTLDGAVVNNLTNTPARDEQTPAWRP